MSIFPQGAAQAGGTVGGGEVYKPVRNYATELHVKKEDDGKVLGCHNATMIVQE